MEIRVIELRETAEAELNTTVIVVNQDTVVIVKGLGTEPYTWTVRNCGKEPAYQPEATVKEALGEPTRDGVWSGFATFGPASVWMNPMTFGRMVWDLITNQ